MSRLRRMLTLSVPLVVLLTAQVAAEQRSEAYRAGQRAIDAQDWEDASTIFGKIAKGNGDEADAALYWKAYADWKQKAKRDSLESIQQLLSTYPKSPWADDAKALEMEIRNGKGAAAATETDNEDLKLYALDGLMQVEPEKAVPILERLLAGGSSPRVKERALFVLSQSASPKAREILLRIARTGQPVELRRDAVRTLGIAGGAEDIAALESMAHDASVPPEVKEAVIEAYLISGRPNELAGIARSDPDPRIRLRAIESLGAMGALPVLRQLWTSEKDPKVRGKLLEAFGVAGDVETLGKAARETTDRSLRRKAIEGLGISNGPSARRILRELYGEYSTPEDKKRVLEAFMVQGDARTLIELFRAESDPAMKKIIIQQLSVMNDPEATRLIFDILGEKP